jgi:hypothetical protein
MTTTLPDWTRITNPDNGMLDHRAYVGHGLWIEVRHHWELRPRRDHKVAYFFTENYYAPDVEEVTWDVVLLDATRDYTYVAIGLHTLREAMTQVGAFLG